MTAVAAVAAVVAAAAEVGSTAVLAAGNTAAAAHTAVAAGTHELLLGRGQVLRWQWLVGRGLGKASAARSALLPRRSPADNLATDAWGCHLARTGPSHPMRPALTTYLVVPA